MKYHIPFLSGVCLLLALTGCENGVDTNQQQSLKSKVDSLCNVVISQQATIKSMRDTISMLQFPADQRLTQIKQLIANNKFSEAEIAISDLQSIFPHSQEAAQGPAMMTSISAKIAAIEAEKERIKAQGYKIFKDNLSCSDNEENYNFSGFTFGRTFTFDNCYDVNEYSYRTADKDKTYLSFSLKLSTKKKYASSPGVYIYELAGDKLKCVTSCMDEYASWTSYGAKIGNYSDDSHDFSKVNSVNFKYAGEIEQSKSKKPLFVLFFKKGYNLKNELSVEDVQNDCIVIKILNRSAI